uniref:Transcription initiation factor TFIID component TAF4 C-terminal domain-containing protein n=1 Tax=Oryzias sinensis TaxID=183150 RepID=A0A8C7XFF1_9TELE
LPFMKSHSILPTIRVYLSSGKWVLLQVLRASDSSSGPAISTQSRADISHRGGPGKDDDINDVASMAGVNLREENARNLTSTVGSVVQSCQDQLFLSPHDLLTSILHTGNVLFITDVGPDVVAVVSHATQEYLRELVEKISAVAKHRRGDSWHDRVSDVCSQLRFLEEIEKLKKKRRDEEEKEKLLHLARLQQMEEAQLQQKEANLTALAAIGPRKKRVLDQSNGQVCGHLQRCTGEPGLTGKPGTQKVTRVVLKDLLVCMEQDPVLHRSLTFYKAMLFTV